MKKRKKRLKILKLIGYLFLLIVAYFIGESIYENYKTDQKIEAFKQRAYETVVEEKYGTTYFYHKVKRTYDYEIEDSRNVFYDENKIEPGLKGDILLTFQAPFPYIPIIDPIISYWLGGHAALVSDNNKIIQSTGMTSNGLLDLSTMFSVILHRGYDETNKFGVSVQEVRNYWLKPTRNETHAEYPYYGEYYRTEILTTRLKYKDQSKKDEEIDIAVNFGKNQVDRGLYNYLFIFDTKNKFYCSDLITRAFNDINRVNDTDYNIDEDGFIPSIHDILLSDDIYITIYKETKSDGIHIYYLEDVI
ncbi:hypothetical protein [Acholeplasma granularum]|uniref:hypothetical protein n=1 Tax=Acholeplasma granularum TaxID=264635 RepID=UPI0004B5A9CB|nr:hypothetical protein [Acholeplasma granularum]